MPAIIPTNGFLFSPGGDLQRIALGRTIDKADEIGDHVERSNALYSIANRRALYSKVWIPTLERGVVAAVNLPDVFARSSADRDELAIVSYGLNIVVVVSVFNASTSALLGSAQTLTHSGATLTEQTATYTGITVQDVLIRVNVAQDNASLAAGELSSFRALEIATTAADLPL